MDTTRPSRGTRRRQQQKPAGFCVGFAIWCFATPSPSASHSSQTQQGFDVEGVDGGGEEGDDVAKML